METDFPVCKPLHKSVLSDENCENADPFRYEEHGWITLERMKKAIEGFKPHKQSGPDEIKPIVLQGIQDNTLKKLKTIYNAIISAGFTPKLWRTLNITMLKKPGKSDYSQAKSFRPITLACHLLKLLERLVLWHLEDTILQEKPISLELHAFRHGQGCESANISIINEIERTLKKGKLEY